MDAKLALIIAAAILAGAQVTNLPDELTASDDFDGSLQAENILAFRLAHTFYDGLLRAYESDVWKSPSRRPNGSTPIQADALIKRLLDLFQNTI